MVGSPLTVCPRCGVLAMAHRWQDRRDSRGRLRPCGLTPQQVYAVCAAGDDGESSGFRFAPEVGDVLDVEGA